MYKKTGVVTFGYPDKTWNSLKREDRNEVIKTELSIQSMSYKMRWRKRHHPHQAIPQSLLLSSPSLPVLSISHDRSRRDQPEGSPFQGQGTCADQSAMV